MSLLPLIAEVADRGAFAHRDHQRVAVPPEFHVGEQAGAEHGPDRLGNARRIELVADADGQVIEDRALGDPLQALDAHVAHDERSSCCASAAGRPRSPRTVTQDGHPELEIAGSLAPQPVANRTMSL
jgi:hypothetical protein